MPDATANLLIELIQEEIPARMQVRAAEDLARLFAEQLAAANLGHAVMHSFVGPRHLALYVEGLALQQPDSVIEKRGPRVDAPEQAIAGFLKSTGLSRDELIAEETPKGVFLFARTGKKGVPTIDLLPAMIGDILGGFPWPKSQRWGTTRFRWVRPLHRVNVLLDGVGLDGNLDLGGATLAFGTKSCGHFFEAPRDLDLTGITSPSAYVALLRDAHVIVDSAERYTAIHDGATQLAAARDCRLRTSDAKVAEIAGLVEHPTLLVGTIEDRFMQLPGEVLQSSIETHQKYITLETEESSLSPHFILVSNRLADPDRDAVILAGNQRVLRARLVDAEFFWLEDSKTPLADYLPRLADIAFYEGLGTVHDKAMRLEKLAAVIAAHVPDADPACAARAAKLAKADLVTGMVGEFPELQGIMGGYYAGLAGEDAAVGAAIATHYRPQGPDDKLPDTPEGLAVALADKVDTLVGFFGVGARPTGSKDPFALRRAALGLIRVILESRIQLPLGVVLAAAADLYGFDGADAELLPFIRERLRVSLRDSGVAHDVVAAALGDEPVEDVLWLADRANALGAFLKTDDGAGLMAGWRRAASILAAEEAKEKGDFPPETDPALFVSEAEASLFEATAGSGDDKESIARSPEELMALMQALGRLRQPIDGFFDQIIVNDDDPKVRRNRLGLLSMVRARMSNVADFSRVEG